MCRAFYLTVAIATLGLLCPISHADDITSDFSSGAGSLFQTWNDGGHWTLDDSGGELRVSKPSDDLSFEGSDHIRAGWFSTFVLEGDFSVTVDYTVYDMPAALSNSYTYPHLLLAPFEEPGSTFSRSNFLTMRFRQAGSQEIEAWHIPPGSIYGRQAAPAALMSAGRFRITRVGNAITSSFASPGSEVFTQFGSAAGSTEPLYVQLFAGQGETCTFAPNRAGTTLDVAFDNLIFAGASQAHAQANHPAHRGYKSG